MKNIRYEKLTADNYAAYLELCNQQIQGPMLLPNKYDLRLWGIVVYRDEQLIGGWVGTKRLSGRLSWLYQEVVFDSTPQIFQPIYVEEMSNFIQTITQYAKQDAIVSLVLSHWSRGEMPLISQANFETNATFLIDVQQNDLFMTLEHSQRKQIRKAEREEVAFVIYSRDEAIQELEAFDNIRKTTQERAISNNSKSSMLLKSSSFYKNILLNYNSTMVACKTKDGQIGAMLLFLQSGATIYLYFSGSDIAINKATGCSSYLHWCIFNYAKEIGCKYVDMGGVPVSPKEVHPAYGVYKYKKSFGGEYKEYTSGDIVISTWRYKLIQLIKQNRTLLRLLSKKL